jgi:hypothetical protein
MREPILEVQDPSVETPELVQKMAEPTLEV